MARPNGVRELWQAGKPVINSWLGIPSSFSAEVMANAGWDSLVVDMQHGMIDYQMMITMLQGISTTNTTPLVRVPWNDPAHIQKSLDAGAYGIICPMINNRAEAEKFVSSMRYAPVGSRSSGPIRASLYGGPDYHAKELESLELWGTSAYGPSHAATEATGGNDLPAAYVAFQSKQSRNACTPDVAKELALPPVKIHCSVLAEDAIKAAIADYRKKRGEAPTATTGTSS